MKTNIRSSHSLALTFQQLFMLLRVQASGLGPVELRTLIPRHHSLPTHPVSSTTAAPEGKSVCICSAPAWDTLPHLPQACVHLTKHHRGAARPFLRALFTTAASSQQLSCSPLPATVSPSTRLFHMLATFSKSPTRTVIVSALFFAASPRSSQGLAQGRHPTNVC